MATAERTKRFDIINVTEASAAGSCRPSPESQQQQLLLKDPMPMLLSRSWNRRNSAVRTRVLPARAQNKELSHSALDETRAEAREISESAGESSQERGFDCVSLMKSFRVRKVSCLLTGIHWDLFN